MKLKETLMGNAQSEEAYPKDFKCISFEILSHRTWKGCPSSCQPCQPNQQIRLAWQARASKALPCPMC